MKRQFVKSLCRNIREIKGAKGITYEVRINRKDFKINKVFPTLELAQEFLNETIKIYNSKYHKEIMKELDVLTYPENLIELLDVDIREVEEFFDARLNTFELLNPRELKILLSYFKDSKTLNEIAQEYNVSHARPAQIIAHAIRKIKRHINYFIFGDYANLYHKRKKDYDLYLESMKDQWTYESAKDYIDSYNLTHNPLREESITTLDISLRSYNCLRRSGILTVEDLINCTDLDLMKIRNLGRKCIKEIKHALNKINLHLKDE